ncbi:Tim44 domain-containing protein [Rivibacter subsaxonicus]|uniref:Putative lipid-binding transport protein (Tim44 family) n=1 Tax=Rivibacter subsaxonicus TaxID=457575 RepID=A0A4Q7W1Y3_9BURK|nr:TIM44-like domain-containing protein [Rivibacter subsaxonicus]RZU02968.1 putative lipid-binding transport protein (Tim44 family) [Rivibacter subsaxonicus]
MKSWLIALSLAIGATMSLAPIDAEAKRLGGGKSAGMQRQAPAKPADSPNATPAQPAQPSNAAAPATAGAGAGAAAAGKRSWMGPIAGIAAGLGIAALMSHLGMGEAFGNFLTVLLLAGVAFFVIRWLMGRMSSKPNAGPQLAGAGAGAAAPTRQIDLRPQQGTETMQRTTAEPAAAALAQPTAAAAVAARPEGFDAEAFERIAKMIFIRLQAANDAGAVEDLRKFTTPELFASLRLDLQERHGAAQQTDVLQLEAKVVDTAQEDGQWIATVRFRGLIREQSESAAEPFDELWHLVRPLDNSREWAIAGITQAA